MHNQLTEPWKSTPEGVIMPARDGTHVESCNVANFSSAGLNMRCCSHVDLVHSQQ